MKRLNKMICTLMLIWITLPITVINAEPTNVLDCLDNEDCFEQEENDEEETDESNALEIEQMETGSVGMNILKMFFALLLVLALIYVAVKLLSNRHKLNNRITSLENLGGISVGNNKSVQIIRVGQSFYLIGVGENVELLKEIVDPDVINILLSSESTADESVSSLFTSIFHKQKNSKREESNKFKDQFTKELNKIKHQRQTLINKHTEKEDEHD